MNTIRFACAVICLFHLALYLVLLSECSNVLNTGLYHPVTCCCQIAVAHLAHVFITISHAAARMLQCTELMAR